MLSPLTNNSDTYTVFPQDITSIKCNAFSYINLSIGGENASVTTILKDIFRRSEFPDAQEWHKKFLRVLCEAIKPKNTYV